MRKRAWKKQYIEDIYFEGMNEKQTFGEWGLRLRNGSLEMYTAVGQGGPRTRREGTVETVYTRDQLGIWEKLGTREEWVEGDELKEKVWLNQLRQKANISTHRVSLFAVLKDGQGPET